MKESTAESKKRGLAASLALRKKTGLTSHQIHEQKIKNFCNWIYKWGWSSTVFLDEMLEGTKRGFTKKMIKKGLAVSHANERISFTKGWPNDFVTLTRMGIEYLQQFDDIEIDLEYPKNGLSLVNINQTRHDLLCQKYIFKKRKELENLHGDLEQFEFDYKTSRMIRNKKSEEGIKEPDIIMILNGDIIAIEIELTIKKDRELDQFCSLIIRSLQKNEYDEIHIISSNSIINKYSKVLHDINAKVSVWRMKENRTWFKTDKVIESNEEIAEKIKFYKLQQDATTTLAKKYEKNTRPIIIIEDDEDEEERPIIIEDDEDDDFDPLSLLKK